MLPSTGVKTQSSGLPWEQLCRRFSLAEIQLATQNFNDELVIGRGGFGKVYRGVIDDDSGKVAAFKRLDSGSKQGAPQFWAEIEMLSKLRHCHLVPLFGYCNDLDEMILVYDLMPNGTLADHLHKIGPPLTWLQRLKVCVGAARGLDYLHTGTGIQHGVIHRDVKSSNILLDQNWAAKISDFGLSKIGPTNQPTTFVSTAVKGTIGYLDPEYFLTGRLTRKSDVYSFGVVLLEVLCGRPAVDTSLDEERWSLVRWAQDCIKEGKLEQIIDSSLRGQILLNCLKQFAQIAERCLCSHPKDRPTFAEVVVTLEHALSLQETPDYSELDYSATPVEKLSFTRKMQKFFFPSTVHGESSLPRKNGENKNGTFSDKNLLVNTESGYQLPPRRSDMNPLNITRSHEMDDSVTEEQRRYERASTIYMGALTFLDRSPDQEANRLNFMEPPGIVDFDVDGQKGKEFIINTPLTSILEEASSLIREPDEDVDNGNDTLPEIHGLQIVGEAFPGQALNACGYSVNGTTHCYFQWVRHCEDGALTYIHGADEPTYIVSADDVDSLLSVEVQPLDDEKKNGTLVKCFANSNRRISCDPKMQHHIWITLIAGQASYELLSLVGAQDTWEPATLEIKTEGYSIKTGGSKDVVVTEKFSPATVVNLKCKVPSEFSIAGFGGVEWCFRTEDSLTDGSCSRDTIVLTLRLFIKRAAERKERKEDDELVLCQIRHFG